MGRHVGRKALLASHSGCMNQLSRLLKATPHPDATPYGSSAPSPTPHRAVRNPMRHCALILIAGVALFAALVTPTEAEVIRHQIRFDTSELRLEEIAGETRLTLGNRTPSAEADYPGLVYWIDLPDNEVASRVELTNVRWEQMDGTYGPALPQAKWGPPSLGSHYSGRLRGRDLLVVDVTPVQGRQGKLRRLVSATLVVETEPRVTWSNRLEVRRESPGGLRLTKQLHTTPLPSSTSPRARTLAPAINSGAPFAPTFRPTVDGSPVEMVILTDSTQAPEYQRLGACAVGVQTG